MKPSRCAWITLKEENTMVCDIDYQNPRNNGSGPGCPEYCLDWPLVGVDNTTGIAIFNWSELTTTIGGFLWGFGLFYVIASVVAYILRRRYSVYLQRRGCLLIYVTSLGLLPLLHGLEYREFTGRENYPCALFLFVQFATFPLFITPYAIRTYLLYQRYRYKRLQVLYWENNNGKASMEQRTTANFAKIPDKPACRVTKAQLARVKRRSTEWYGTKLLIGFSLFVLLIYLAMILPRPYKYGMNCLGCDDDFFEIAILTVLDVAICSASLLALYKVHHEKDPLELISELKFSFLCNVGIVQTSLLLHVIDIGKAQRMGRWEWGHVIVVGLLAMFTCTIPYQLYKSWKNESNLVANDEDEINHILGDQQAGMFLLHYLNTEFSTENYYFYSNARFWEQQYDENSAEERSKLAKQIGAEFLEFGSPLEVNVPYHVRSSTLESLKQEDIPKDCFKLALEEVQAVLREDSFPRFRKSEFYTTYRRTYFLKDDTDSIAVSSTARCCC